LNLGDIRETARRLTDRWYRDDPQRAKLVIVCAVAAIAVVMLGISLRSVVGGRPRARALDTPGWRMARELTEKLNARPAFMDTGFVVESERPLRLKLVGGVRTQRELSELREFVKTLRPGEAEDSYEFAVEVTK